MSKAWIIVKYADEAYRKHTYGSDYEFSQNDNIFSTFTGRQISLPEKPFSSREEAKLWLGKAQEFNPTVGYDLIEIEI